MPRNLSRSLALPGHRGDGGRIGGRDLYAVGQQAAALLRTGLDGEHCAGGHSDINRPLATTVDMASSSDITPPRHAAAYSPTLWPIIASGCTPRLSSQQASAYDTAKRAGCAFRVCARLRGSFLV